VTGEPGDDIEICDFMNFVSQMELVDLPILGRQPYPGTSQINVRWCCITRQLWGPKPFRFNNFWLSHKGLKDVVVRNWYFVPTMGWMTPILKEKLKVLNGDLKRWNKEVFSNLSFQIEILIERVNSFDVLAEERIYSLEEVSDRNQMTAEL